MIITKHQLFMITYIIALFLFRLKILGKNIKVFYFYQIMELIQLNNYSPAKLLNNNYYYYPKLNFDLTLTFSRVIYFPLFELNQK